MKVRFRYTINLNEGFLLKPFEANLLFLQDSTVFSIDNFAKLMAKKLFYGM